MRTRARSEPSPAWQMHLSGDCDACLGADTHAVSLSLTEETTRMASRRTPSDSSSSSKSRTKPAATPEPVTVPPAVTAVAPKKAAPSAKRAAVARPVITPDMRRGMIAEAAYLRAERRGFAPGYENEDWLAAEAEVDRLLSADLRAPQ